MTQATVKVHYSGFLTDGTIFDSSLEGDPFEITLGDGSVIPGFEAGLLGMAEGDEKTLAIPAEHAYGARDEGLVAEIARSQIPPEIDPQVGAVLQITSAGGDASNVIITQVSDTSITLDGNHPLAGQELIFEVKMVEVVAV